MGRRIIGLDIGDTTLSGVLVSSSLKGNVVEAAARVPLEGEDGFEANLALALARLAEAVDFSGALCNVSLPASTICFRNLIVPFHNKNKIRQVLPFEIEPHLPHPVENLVFDFQKTGLNREAGCHLIAAAVEKRTVAAVLNGLETYKVEPEIITARGHAAAVCLADTPDLPGDWSFCDLGERTLSLFVVSASKMVMTRATLLRATQTATSAAEICTQIRRTLLAVEDIIGQTYEPERLFVSGSRFANTKLDRKIEHALNIPVHRADLTRTTPGNLLENPERLQAPDHLNNALALVCLELAGRNSFNFRKGPFERKKQWVLHRKRIVTSSLIALLVSMLVFGDVFLDNLFLEKRVNQLDREIAEIFKATFPEVKRIVNPLQQANQKLQDARQNLLPAQTGNKHRVIDILNALSSGIPRTVDVVLTQVVMNPESLLISGHTANFNSVDDIQNRLEKDPAFRKVTISSANLEKSGDRINFKLKVQL